ncbi:hypothetical protein ACOMHN_059891 [Nucella lapillus]
MLQLLMLSLLLVVCMARPRRIDCTVFVYAPVCRGVAAKRGGDSLSLGGSTELDDALTESLLRPEEPREDNSEKNWREWSRLSKVIRLVLSSPERGTERLERLLTMQ